MPRLLFSKTGNAVWMSHLDLMRLLQRAFQRAQLPLTHTQGYSPRPSVSIAMPLSVGVESECELLDFELTGEPVTFEDIRQRLNAALPEGVRVLQVYETGRKIREIATLRCKVVLEYGSGVPQNAGAGIGELFHREDVTVDKKGKNGTVPQNIIPMIQSIHVTQPDVQTLILEANVCCQNPSLNPMQLVAAIERYLPQWKPDFAHCRRLEIYDKNQEIFR